MKDAYYLDPRVAASYDADSGPERDIVRDDIPFYVELAAEAAAAGHAVLELGCGTGRVTVPIARAGVRITGLDASPAMLDVARAKAAGIDNISWVKADMADFRLEQQFGLVIIPFRSYLLLLTVEEQKSCLRCIHDHLVEGGRLALNFFNPDLVMMAKRLERRRSAFQARDDERPSGGLRRWEKTEYNTALQSMDWTQRREQLSAAGRVVRVEKTLRMRYIFRYEMEHLLALTGFEVEALYGWFDRRPFDEASAEMVWLARRVQI
jgi:SAM-dependent methyltransferase